MEALPAELFYHIAEYASPETLYNLRLVSRDVHSAVEPSFLAAFFHERYYACTRFALQSLVEVSAHPVLRKRLKLLVFCISNPYLWDIEGIRTIIERRRECGPQQSMHDQLPHVDDYKTYLANRATIVPECMSLLVTALRQLSEAGVRPELEFRAKADERCSWPYGTRRRLEAMRALQKIGLSRRNRDENLDRAFPWFGVSDAVGIGLAAMARAGFKPLELELGGYDEKEPISGRTFDLGSHVSCEGENAPSSLDIGRAADMWCDLTSLTLCLDEQHFSSSPGEHAIDPWLLAATSLKSLRLCFPSCYEDRWHLQRENAERFIRLLKDAPLERLWMDDAWFAEEGFTAFLTQHASTLRHLVTSLLHFPRNVDCASVFRWMAENLKLEVFDMWHPTHDDEILLSHLDYNHLLIEECDGGEEAVRAALEEAALNFENEFSIGNDGNFALNGKALDYTSGDDTEDGSDGVADSEADGDDSED